MRYSQAERQTANTSTYVSSVILLTFPSLGSKNAVQAVWEIILDRLESASPDAETAMEVELDSVTLARLLEEVRNPAAEPAAYNRMHNRHNRS